MSSEQNKVILRAEHISKTYGEKKVLEDISIHLEQGELVSLLGVSGSGKTARESVRFIPARSSLWGIRTISMPESEVSSSRLTEWGTAIWAISFKRTFMEVAVLFLAEGEFL